MIYELTSCTIPARACSQNPVRTCWIRAYASKEMSSLSWKHSNRTVCSAHTCNETQSSAFSSASLFFVLLLLLFSGEGGILEHSNRIIYSTHIQNETVMHIFFCFFVFCLFLFSGEGRSIHSDCKLHP